MIILAEYIILKEVIKVSVLRFSLSSGESDENLISIIKASTMSPILLVSSSLS